MVSEAKITDKDSKSHLPIDRGWAWMILIGAGMTNFFLVGTLKSFGFFFVAFIEKYNCSVTVATLIGAMYNTVFLVVSTPLLIFGVKRFSIRSVCIVGTVIFSLGYGLCSLAPNIATVVIFQSVLCGGGDACLMPPAVIILGKYFEKRRGLANGLSFACISLGGLVLPNLYRYLLDEYGLQGALILTSGVVFHMLIAASLFRPLTFYQDYHGSAEQINSNREIGESENYRHDLEIPSSNDVSKYNGEPESNIKLLSSSDFSDVESQTASNKRQENTSPTLQSSVENFFAIESHLSGSVISLTLDNVSSTRQIEHSSHEEISKDESLCSRVCTQGGANSIPSLLCNKEFLVFVAVFTLGSVTTVNMLTFFPHFAQQRGIDRTRTALLISVIGIADFFGRILCGFLADRKCIKRVHIIIISQFILAAILYFSFLFRQFWELVIFACILGSVIGMVIALFAPVTVDIIGTEAFATGMTIILIVQAIFHGVSMVFLGYLRDVTGNYLASFYYMATTSMLAVLLLLIKPLANKTKNLCNHRQS